MSEEDAFLEGIAADRADRTRLLVFADWLADQSDPREEFVRLHAQLLEMDGTGPEFAELETRWKAWANVTLAVGDSPAVPSRLSPRWLDALGRVFTAGDLTTFLANPSPARAVSLQRQSFDSSQHIDDSWEEEVVFYRGATADFYGPLDFITRTVLSDLFQTESMAESEWRYLSAVVRGSFWQHWRARLSALHSPPPLPVLAPDNHFLGAQYIEGDWNNWALVAMHRHDYFALFWSTTA